MNRYLGEGVRRAILENYELARSMEMPGPERTHLEDRFYAWVPRGSL
jgi:hypothetical protein